MAAPVAAETGKSIPQIALNWLLRRPTVSSIILGARNETMPRTAQRQVDDFYARMDALRSQLPSAQCA